MLQWMKDQSKRRRLLLSEQLGVGQGDQLCQVLGTQDERDKLSVERRHSSSRPKPSTSVQPAGPCSEPANEQSAKKASEKQNLRGNSTSAATQQKPATNASGRTRGKSRSRRRGRRGRKHSGARRGSSARKKLEIAKASQKTVLPSTTKSLISELNRAVKSDVPTITEDDDEDEDGQVELASKYEYKGSSTFLKGTQSANPHNDYCQHYVDTGQRPQNFIRDYELHDRFEEYPKLKELIKLKDELIAQTATPPMYLKCELRESNDLRHLDSKFDVILIDAPLEEYQRTQGVTKTRFWSWDSIMHLEIEEIAAPRSFVFLWCGSSDGLDLGRQCLRKWGFRRCEDICWIKTNKKNIGHNKNLEPKAIFQRTKEHCLMGIKGTVRRSTDGDFIHSNVDIDLIISEEPPYGTYEKPDEIFHIIEHFCLGRRRLHLFGRDSTIRPGWLTVGPELTNSNFNSDLYKDYFARNSTDFLTGCTDRIETLRPKSPPPKGMSSSMQQSNVPHSYRKRF